MIRLYVTDTISAQSSISLSEAHIHYLFHVMRQKEGNQILIFNGKDGEWLCQISALSKKQGILSPLEQTRPQTKGPEIILCPALIKKENMDLVLQKATELGASQIIPVITQRTIISRFNLDRAHIQVQEASEQCERLSVPKLTPPQSLSSFLETLPSETTLVCLSERGKTTAAVPKGKPIAFLIGPEGGFTPEELKIISNRPHTLFCHFDGTILRAETASIAILSCYCFDIFNPID